MNSKVHKRCAVPQCKNTSTKTSEKLFIYVPHKKTMRYKWLNLARRDPTAVSLNTPLYFCEDHFDLPNDMDNYIQYLVMGSVPKVLMKPGCVPTKFECQPDRRKRISTTVQRPYILKKQRKMLVEESIKYSEESSTVTKQLESEKSSTITKQLESEESSTVTKQLESEETSYGSSVLHEIEDLQEVHKTADKSIQVLITPKFRSKAIQTEIKSVNQMTSPFKPNLQSVSTSPFKVKSCVTTKPLIFNLNKASRKLFTKESQSDSDTSYTSSATHRESSPTKSLQMKSTSDYSELIEDDKKQEASKILEYTIIKIMKNPRSYIGVPKSCYYLVDLIVERTSIPANYILLCLKKIRLNNSFRELADDFSMNPVYASKIFLKNIPIIASIMRPFIVKLDQIITKCCLPMAFRHKYHHVSCIIDCLEIEIQKLSKSVNQAFTWSEYKKANTIKYLVSCTPNGLVNYISPGYGGKITDTCLVESCDFLKCLQPGMCVMADRGFKHIEQYLRKEGVQLVRPPSVVTGTKLSKSEVRETKQIASLRIHVERVIRRLREFTMLKPHACLNHNLVKVLDDVITIACGLINLQDSLIK